MLIRFEGNENDQNFHEKMPMELNIENFAKIKSAKIKLDGITAIAGLNNTGKSTVGKILYGIFSAVANIDKSVVQAKKRNIRQAVVSLLLQNVRNFHGGMPQGVYKCVNDFIEKLVVAG